MQAPVERQVSAAYNSIPSLDSARIALIKKNGEMAPRTLVRIIDSISLAPFSKMTE